MGVDNEIVKLSADKTGSHFHANGDEQELLASAEEVAFTRERFIHNLRLLWNRRRFLLRCLVIGLVAGTLLAFLIPRRFQSSAQLMPPDQQSSGGLALLAAMSGPGGMSGSGGLGMLAGDLLGIKSTGALFVGVLRSRTVADRIIDQFDLKKVYWESLQEKAREQLAENTTITEDRKSGIITITVTDHDRKRAAAMAAGYVNELNALIAQVSTSAARRERIFLEDRLSNVKLDLESAEKDFSHFASNRGAIDIPAQGRAMVEATATLEGQLIAAQAQLQGLKQIYSDQNVRVRATQARIDELRQQLHRLTGKTDERAVDGVEQASDNSYPTLRQLPILGVPYADKLRRLKIQEAVFETLTKQYELAKVQEAKEIPSVKELDAPIIPERKSYPPRLLITILGMLFGLMVGVMWVLGKNRWQQLDAQDSGKVLAQEVFSTVAAHLPWNSRNGKTQEADHSETASDQQKEPATKGVAAGG